MSARKLHLDPEESFMKKIYISAAFFAVFATVASVPAFGQKAKQTSDEVGTITGKAERKLDNASFRVVLTTEWFTERDGTSFNKITETFATINPDRFQIISETGGTRVETLVVADKTFRRTNEEDWESVATSPARKAGSEASVARFGELAGGAVYPIGNSKFVSRGTIDGQEVSMYEARAVQSDNSKEGMTRTETTQFWINNGGQIVRKIIEQDIAGDKRFMRSVANYSYTDIRIEEPIMPIKAKDK